MRIFYIILITIIYLAVGLGEISDIKAILAIVWLISMYILLNK